MSKFGFMAEGELEDVWEEVANDTIHWVQPHEVGAVLKEIAEKYHAPYPVFMIDSMSTVPMHDEGD